MTRPRKQRTEGRAFRIFLRLWVVMVALLLVAPTLIVIPMSFSSSSTFRFPPPGWSMQWYHSFFESPEWIEASWASVRVGLVSATASVVFGVMAALGLSRWGDRGRAILNAVVMLPLVVPLVVVGVAVYATFLSWGLNGSFLGLVIAHTVLGTPFAFVAVSASLRNYDPRLDLASATLGAGPITTFRRVTAPLIAPGLGAGFILAFASSFDEVVIAQFLRSPDFVTLPVLMLEAIVLDIDPTMAAAATLVVLTTTVVILTPEVKRIWRGRRK